MYAQRVAGNEAAARSGRSKNSATIRLSLPPMRVR
jgi:hypothetical protein